VTTSRPARLLRLLLPGLLLTGMAVGLPGAAAADVVYTVSYVTGKDGDLLRVETMRDPSQGKHQPVILTLSPYNDTTAGSRSADDSLAARYVKQGYVRAVADVLGTRASSGCWDYGGAKEQQAGVDVVKWLAHQPWSNGRVGMTGVSYDGTTANMVAATGIPELKAIAPVAAISRWYGYAYDHGVRFFGNSKVLTDEGIDTPIAFDIQEDHVPLLDPTDPHFVDYSKGSAEECGAVEHTMQGYSRTPDYGPFWLQRDYLKDAKKFRAAVFFTHGWQDYNVKQIETLQLWDALPVDNPRTKAVEGVPFKRLWLTQNSHGSGSGDGYQDAMDSFWDATLKHSTYRDPHIPMVTTLGRSTSGADKAAREYAAWPPPGTTTLPLHLGRSFIHRAGVPAAVPDPVGAEKEDGTLELAPQNDGDGWTWFDSGAVTEEMSLRDPLNDKSLGYYSLYQRSAPLKKAVRIAGSAVLDAWVNASTPGQHLTPLLVDAAPDGTLGLIERGFLNLSYRNGLAKADPKTGWLHARVRFLPQDYLIPAGHRIGLLIQSSNTVWAVPGAAGPMSIAMGPVSGVTKVGATLLLPLVAPGPARSVLAK
jgi:X-Pro dipeptidyl-peptidase